MSVPAASEDSVPHRIETFLGEFRMIIPAMAALFGFQLTVAFQQSFSELGFWDRAANFAGLVCTAAAFLFLLVPASYHRFIAKLEETEDFLRFARASISAAFVFMPFALSFALYVQAYRSFGSHAAALAIALVLLVAFAAGWWVMPRIRARARGHGPPKGS